MIGYIESAEFVENAAKRPEIGPEVVLLVGADFGGQIVRSADKCLGGGAVQDLGNTKVANFDELIGGEKDVGRLQIPVEDVLGVQGLDPHHQHHEPGHDDLLLQQLPLLLGILEEGGEIPDCVINRLHSQYSMTMTRVVSNRKHSLYFTMKGYILVSLNFSRISICVSNWVLLLGRPARQLPACRLSSSSWLRTVSH